MLPIPYLTPSSNHEDEEVDIVRSRLAKLLKKQEPVEDYFSRIGVSHGKYVAAVAQSTAFACRLVTLPDALPLFSLRTSPSPNDPTRWCNAIST
jgi:hypothetical protein